MPSFELTSGLPSYPEGLPDKEAATVAPLYRAISALTQQVSVATGKVNYSAAERDLADPFTKLTAGASNKVFVRAAVQLNYGALVNLYLVGGKVTARLADATPGIALPAHGIVDVIGGIPAGTTGEVLFMNGRTSGIAGTDFGARYFLSTGGAVQALVPTAPGAIVQIVGVGLGSAGFYLQIIPGG